MRPEGWVVLGLVLARCAPDSDAPAALAGVEYFDSGTRLVPRVA